MYLGAPIKPKETTNENKPRKINEYKLPKDIGPGLLKFCLTHSDSPNLQDTVLPPDRDPKDYDWLKEAFDNLEDDAKKMKKLLEVFDDDNNVTTTESENNEKQQATATTIDPKERETKYLTSLKTLEFYIEDLDNAGDFIKIGGIPVLIKLICDSTVGDQVRAEAASCLSIITQSESTIQAYLHQLGVLELSVKQLQKEVTPFVREKFLSLISSLLSYEINNFTFDKSILNTIVELSTSFLSPTVDLTITTDPDNNNNGVEPETTVVSITNSTSGISKACFLLNKIFIAMPEIRGFAIKCGTLDGLISLIKAFNKIHSTSKEPLLDTQIVMVEKAEAVLYQLIKDNTDDSLEQCKSQQLSSEIEKRISFINSNLNSSDYVEEIKILNNIKLLLK